MKPSQLEKILIALIPAHENLLLVGSPGLGKTDLVHQVCTKLGYGLITTHPVVSDPTDFKGMPALVPTGKGKDAAINAEFLPFGDLRVMITADKPTVVFMDDIGQAPPAVQAAIMQLILARQINGHQISEHIHFVAATNRRQDKAAVTGLITPLLDRFTTVINVDFDLDDWVRWGLDNEMPPELLAFARFRPDRINAFEATRDMKKSPTPRSVAGIGRLVNKGILDYEVLSGAAGESFATEFLAFYRTYKELPDRNTIYLNPDKVPVPEKTDVLYALMGALAHGATETNFEATVKYLNRCPAEFSVLCIKDALHRKDSLKSTNAFTRWALDHADVFGYVVS